MLDGTQEWNSNYQHQVAKRAPDPHTGALWGAPACPSLQGCWVHDVGLCSAVLLHVFWSTAFQYIVAAGGRRGDFLLCSRRKACYWAVTRACIEALLLRNVQRACASVNRPTGGMLCIETN